MSDTRDVCLDALRTSSRNEKQKILLKIKNIFEQNLEESDNIVSEFLLNYETKYKEDINNEIEIALLIATCILLHASSETCKKIPQQLWLELRSKALQELSESSDLDLRKTSGSYIGSLCKRNGIKIYQEILDNVNSQISSAIKKCEISKKCHNDFKTVTPKTSPISNTPVSFTGITSAITSPNDISSHLSAWKLLDTWLYTLNRISQSTGKEFCVFIDDNLIHYLEESMKNEERFVRESCCVLIKTLIDECQLYHYTHTCSNSILHTIVNTISLGMCDTWPDVRLPACLAARSLLLSSKKEEKIDENLLIKLLPYLCFNRLLYSKNTHFFQKNIFIELNIMYNNNILTKQ